MESEKSVNVSLPASCEAIDKLFENRKHKKLRTKKVKNEKAKIGIIDRVYR